MKLLILGGTIFLGRYLVESAKSRGHEVTIFNRGQSNPNLFTDVEELHGDRDGNLDSLRGRKWDAVVDTCGYLPRIVGDSVALLADAVEHYTFISSISVYSDLSQAGISESDQVGEIGDDSIEEVTGKTYGPLKALCERVAESLMPGRVLNIRPGLIVGPHDPSDRFTYWPNRIAQGGEILAPGEPTAPVQIIDVRDLAEWILNLIEEGTTGVFNAAGPDYPLKMKGFLEKCRSAIGGEVDFTWVNDNFLLDHEISPWVELPFWLPEDESAGMLAVRIDKALKAGLVFRPLEETIQNTLQWAQDRPTNHIWRAGMDSDKEKELLAAWNKANQATIN